MNSLDPGSSVSTIPAERTPAQNHSANEGSAAASRTPEARGDSSQVWTIAVVGTVVLAIGGGVLLTMAQHSFFTNKAPTAPAPAEPSRPATVSDVKDRSLETIGNLTAAHLYQSYLNIGLLADARESEVYTQAQAEKLLDSVARMLESGDGELARLLKDGLKDEDKEDVERARQLNALLRTQARELKLYWHTGDDSHAKKFQNVRQQSLAGIQAVLGIED
jgi:hypothetical protein